MAKIAFKIAIHRHVAHRDGEVVAQWLTFPAMLAEMAHLGIQRVLRMANVISADEPMIVSAFADTPDDIRYRVRQRRREQQAAWACFDQTQRESAGKVTGIDHAALALEPGATALVDYQLPGGGSFVVSVTSQGFGWAVPLGAGEVQAWHRPLVDDVEPGSFTVVDEVVTSVLEELAGNGLGQGENQLECVMDNGTTEIAGDYPGNSASGPALDRQLLAQTVILATVATCWRAMTLADPAPIAIPETTESGFSVVRGPPPRTRVCTNAAKDCILGQAKQVSTIRLTSHWKERRCLGAKPALTLDSGMPTCVARE